MSDVAIKIENVGKQYRLGLVTTGTLSHDLNRWWKTAILRQEDPYLKIGETNDRTTKGASDYVWALRDINMEIKKGDVVGIIGKNGAGKSTLLKLLSRVTTPTTGTIKAHGRIGSLLEVGTGFHPEMTGRENIYMNGAILGMSKQEITRKFDEIVDFSGCERYIDTPVKRYSSGMMVRLGFAVAAHLDPEILIVDEVLAVGDAEFQKKAIGKMQDVSKGEGRTVLFVSHNMTAVKNLCKTGYLLKNGTVDFCGGIDSVIDKYLSDSRQYVGYDLSHVEDFIGSGVLRVGNVEIHSVGCANGYVVNNKVVVLRMEILNPSRISGSLEVAGMIRNSEHVYISYFGCRLKKIQYNIPREKASVRVEAEFETFPFTPQKYFLGLELEVNHACVFKKDEVVSFIVEELDFYESGDTWHKGIVLLKQEWKFD
ncbi:MAG: ABC transporter ATP-binding protein [Bacteroidales bacterium]|nr:ABC transporter ATP-binding protein [Bacteroidales bacterium]